MALTTVLDVQFTGADSTTTFSDLSASGHAVVGNNGAHIQGNRLSLNGANQSIRVSDHADFYFGASDFTWYGKFNADSLSGDRALFEYMNYDGSATNGNDLIALTHNSTTGINLVIKRGGSVIVSGASGAPLSTSTEYLVELSRVDDDIFVKVDGVAVISETISGNMPDCSGNIYWGYSFYALGGNTYWAGTIDDIKIEVDTFTEQPSGDFPAEEDIWLETNGEFFISKMSPSGAGVGGTFGSFIYINSTIPATLTQWPKSYYAQTNPDVVGSWTEIDLNDYGVPDDAKWVAIGGELIITMQGSTSLADMNVHFKQPHYTDNNRIFHAICTQAAGGARVPVFTFVRPIDGKIHFAWTHNSPVFNSSYPTAGINLKLMAWGR